MASPVDEKIRETQRLLGQAAMQISGIDVLLERLFLQVTGLPHDLGATIFLSHDTTKRRRDLLDAVAKIRMNQSQLERWNAIKIEHSAIAERRNRLLHDTWALNPTSGTFALLRQVPPGPFKVDPDLYPQVSDNALEELANRAGGLIKKIIELMQDFNASSANEPTSPS